MKHQVIMRPHDPIVKQAHDPEAFPMWGTFDDMYAGMDETPKRKPEPVQPKDHSFDYALGGAAILIIAVVTILLVKSAAWFH